MSYPKRHPLYSETTLPKVSSKKDQLKTLLVNKFRGKYRAINQDPEATDAIINQLVNTFLANETMTEANLLNLDKKLSAMLKMPKVGKNNRTSSVGSSIDSKEINPLKQGGMGQILKYNRDTVDSQHRSLQ
jgi:hypothetical protein